jgi:hypothetical protein
MLAHSRILAPSASERVNRRAIIIILQLAFSTIIAPVFRGTGQPRPLCGRRASPYVGQEARAIKAFSGEEIAALSNGEGTAWIVATAAE